MYQRAECHIATQDFDVTNRVYVRGAENWENEFPLPPLIIPSFI